MTLCANAILVHSSLHDRFVARLAERVAALRVGDGLVEGVQIGPVISQRALERCEARARNCPFHHGRPPVCRYAEFTGSDAGRNPVVGQSSTCIEAPMPNL
jgi:hypothetical protein